MGKGKGGSGTTKTSKTSSGMRGVAKAKRELRDVLMKVARWERNRKLTGKTTKWNKKQRVRKKSRHDNWNTEGLMKHAALLQSIIDKGRKVRV